MEQQCKNYVFELSFNAYISNYQILQYIRITWDNLLKMHTWAASLTRHLVQ